MRVSAPANRAAATIGTFGPAAQRVRRAGVVAVVVGERDAADPAAVARRRQDRLDVRGVLRAGVDDPARVAPHEPGVRPLERERPGVVGLHEGDVVLCELVHGPTLPRRRRAQRAAKR
jgi:hypothetical protein